MLCFFLVYENFTPQDFWRVPQLLLLMNAYAQCEKVYWPKWKTLEALLKLRLCQSHLLSHIYFIPPFFHPHLHSLPLPISTLSLESKALRHCWMVCIIWHVPSISITKRKVEWLLLVPFEPFGRSRCRWELVDVALIPENHQPVHTVFLSEVYIVTLLVPADTNDESLPENSLFVGTELNFQKFRLKSLYGSQ